MLKKFPAFFSLLLILLFIICSNTEVKSQNSPYINEKRVMSAMRQIYNAQRQYQATFGNGEFGTLFQLRYANLIDDRLRIGHKYGYVFQVFVTSRTATNPARFYATATPAQYRRNGFRSFYIDSQCALRGADKGGNFAGINDPVIEPCTPEIIGENERQVIRILRAAFNAQQTFYALTGNQNYATCLDLWRSGLMKFHLEIGTYRDYKYSCSTIMVTATNPAYFKIQTAPISYGESGYRSFFIDVNGVIRGADKGGAIADGTEPPIENEFLEQLETRD